MKQAAGLVWLTQLGLSVAAPLAGFILLAVWIRDSLGWGDWVLWTGVGFGIVSAVSGLIQSLKQLSKMQASKEDTPPPVSFNDHQ